MRVYVALGLSIAAAALVVPGVKAAGSFVDVGYTVREGNIVKGSGSFTNRGDFDRVCVSLYSETGPQRKTILLKEKCHNVGNPSGFAFSAPDVYAPPNGCGTKYVTKVFAFKGWVGKAVKVSNRVC